MDTAQKFYLKVDHNSNGLFRVETALEKYKPEWVDLCDNEEDADVVILHVVGRQDQVTDHINYLKSKNKKYIIIQYALRSTMRPKTDHWIPLWEDALLVWSYYNLPLWCVEDGNGVSFNFYHSPLGANHISPVSGNNKDFVIATTGLSYLTESVREGIVASQRVGRKSFHLGADIGRNKHHVTCRTGISDEELARYYSRCEFVSGLRRDEGFELPAVEGLLCGARPVLFDRGHYRQWYYGLGVFIPELPRPQVEDALVALFEKGADPVTKEEMEIAKKRFNWETIINNFYERVLWTL